MKFENMGYENVKADLNRLDDTMHRIWFRKRRSMGL